MKRDLAFYLYVTFLNGHAGSEMAPPRPAAAQAPQHTEGGHGRVCLGAIRASPRADRRPPNPDESTRTKPKPRGPMAGSEHIPASNSRLHHPPSPPDRPLAKDTALPPRYSKFNGF